MHDPLPNFAANVRRLRAERGLTQDALAERAHMDASEVRRIERVDRDPGVRVVVRLAQGLGVAAHELLVGVEDPPPDEADGPAGATLPEVDAPSESGVGGAAGGSVA